MGFGSKGGAVVVIFFWFERVVVVFWSWFHQVRGVLVAEIRFGFTRGYPLVPCSLLFDHATRVSCHLALSIFRLILYTHATCL